MSNDAAVYFEQWRAVGGDDVVGAVSFLPWTSTGSSSTGDVGTATLRLWTATGSDRPSGAATLEAWTSAGDAAFGAVGAPSFLALTAAGAAHGNPFGTGAASFAQWTALGYDRPKGRASIEVWTAAGYCRGAVIGVASFEAWIAAQVSGFPAIARWTADGSAAGALTDAYSGIAMNARSAAVSEYTNYRFNSFAKIGADYYGAGPGGLFKLEGITDDGAAVNWKLRTGQHDDKNPGLKRIPEVLLALRSSGKVRVRVYKDDNTYYDYILPAVQTNTIHQHRVVPGKGMRSRYFAVEAQSIDNSDLELDSMQVNMTDTTRRLG